MYSLESSLKVSTAHGLCLFVCQLYDSDGDGILTAVELAGLMGALVGRPQFNTSQIYSELTSRGQANKGENQCRSVKHKNCTTIHSIKGQKSLFSTHESPWMKQISLIMFPHYNKILSTGLSVR